MYREFFSALTSTTLPLAAMAFFIAAFVIVLVRVFVLRRRNDYEQIAALPLDDSPAVDASRNPLPPHAR